MIKKIQQLIVIIHSGDTGTPKEVASKLSVSERMVFKYVDIIKNEFKAPIKYNRVTKTYYFEEQGNLDLRWQKKKG
jgi:hypothetical protein